MRRNVASLLAVLAISIVVASCGSAPYGDLEVGSCVIGNPSVDGGYRSIDCAEARGVTELDRISDASYRIVGKAPDGDAGFSCGFPRMWITDGEWQLCFEPVL